MQKDLYLYNSLNKQKEKFVPLNKDEITVYTCGPTVYSYAHIGNMSAYLMADVLIRVLETLGYSVKLVKNITDVGHLVSDGDEGEDKMQKAAKKEQKTPKEIASFYADAYIEDERLLNMKEPFSRPYATDYVKPMMNMVEKLVEKGFAYETSDGVYMDISKIEDYGILSGNTIEGLDAGARVEVNEEKKHPADFALWKKAEPNHIMQWDSPWGRSFPGWHLECSAMAWEAFQGTYDIKTGGEDNIFPHHECEIAQTQALFGVKLANYYLHKRHIQMDGMKMSKSLGNIANLQDILKEGHSAQAVRYALISSHYRNRLNFQNSLLEEAQIVIDRGSKLIQFLLEKSDQSIHISTDEFKGFQKYTDEFIDALCDDLNMPKAIVLLHEIIKEGNKQIDTITSEDAKALLNALYFMNQVLAVFSFEVVKDEISSDVLALLEKRNQAKADKDYALSDKYRDEIAALGFKVVDTADGVKVEKL